MGETRSHRLEQYTKAARNALVAAQALADEHRHAVTLPLHLCCALLDAHAETAFAGLQERARALASHVRFAIDALPNDAKGPSYLAPALLDVMHEAETAAEADEEWVDERRLAWALGRVQRGLLANVLRQQSITEADIPPPPRGVSPRRLALNDAAARLLEETAPPGREMRIVAALALTPWQSARSRLAAVLARPSAPVALLAGAPGSGRSSFLARFAAEIVEGSIPGLEGCTPAAIDLVDLSADSSGVRLLRERLAELGADPKALVLLDHVDYVGREPSSRGLQELLDVLRPWLVRGTLRAVLVVSPELHRHVFASDALFAARATRVDLPELEARELEMVLAMRARELETELSMVVPASTLEAILRLSCASEARHRPPGASNRLLETAAAHARVEGRSVVEPSDVLAVGEQDPPPVSAQDTLRDLEAKIAIEVQGQDAALATVCRRIRFTKLGLDRRPHRPDGVFLLIGPSGVGKTQLAKAVARALYGDLERLVRFDMSEYMEKHEYSKLIGSPKGYIDSQEGGLLTERVAAAKRGVLLLDEIEKAHPSVLHILLQVLDEGWLTDGRGRKADFGDFTILMTSNLGRELWAHQRKQVGFGVGQSEPEAPDEETVRKAVARVLSTELIGRIDAIVPFRPLSKADLRRIAERLVADEIERWKTRGKLLRVADAVVAHVVERGYDPQLGARHLERNLEELVLQPIGEAVMTDAWRHARDIDVKLEGDAVTVELSW